MTPSSPLCFVLAVATLTAELLGAGDIFSNEIEDVITLPPFIVMGKRVEEFGFRVSGQFAFPGKSYAIVSEVFPHTAAARAGLRPGELVAKVDGKRASIFSLLMLSKMQEQKLAHLSEANEVRWSLEVRAPNAPMARTVTMVVPSPPPHWGRSAWVPPDGRVPAVVPESGPLAARAKEIIDNGIWSVFMHAEKVLGTPPPYKEPLLGFEWRIVQPPDARRFWITQQRGKTEILLEHRSPTTGAILFLTSPSAVLEKWVAKRLNGKKLRENVAPEEAQDRFQKEVDFWISKIGRVSDKWPLEALSGRTEEISPGGLPHDIGPLKLAEEFLKLSAATDTQRALFSDAMEKIGVDSDYWAYTETSSAFIDARVTTVRVDPSRPEGEQCTLLRVDGRPPREADLQLWSSEPRSPAPVLAEIPPLSTLVEMKDVRIAADEPSTVVFEVPVKSNGGVAGEQFCARFRINKTLRALEHFSIRLRRSIGGGLNKVDDMSTEVRFEALDPALAPQPVFIQAGFGMRVLLVKISHSLSTTRSEFTRVRLPSETKDPAANLQPSSNSSLDGNR